MALVDTFSYKGWKVEIHKNTSGTFIPRCYPPGASDDGVYWTKGNWNDQASAKKWATNYIQLFSG
jgi:hypothetical protein